MKKLAILAIAFIVSCGTKHVLVGSAIVPSTINKIEKGYDVNFWVHVTKDTQLYKISTFLWEDSTWTFTGAKDFEVPKAQASEAEKTIGFPHTVWVSGPSKIKISVRAMVAAGPGYASTSTTEKIIEVNAEN